MPELIKEITPEMWRLWEEAQRIYPGVRLGGIFANKKAYHNTVNNNIRFWPLDNYSIRLPLDLVKENRDFARAIDLTMSDSQMVTWTRRMRDSALDPRDNRLGGVREFYGTLDNKTVYGLIKDSVTGEWRRSSADATHLWHGHMGLFTAVVNKWAWLAPIVSTWKGQSLKEWGVNSLLPCEYRMSGENVVYWQYVHNSVRGMVNPKPPELEPDGDYGDATAAAFAAMYKSLGGTAKYDGKKLTGWVAVRYQQLLARREALMLPKPPVVEPKPVDPAVIKQAVNEWMFTNIPDLLTVQGNFSGKVILDDESPAEPS